MRGLLHLRKKWTDREGLSEEQLRLAAESMLEALAYMHKLGIVHRDVKPENVLYLRQGNEIDMKLCDFGLSQKLSTPGGIGRAGTLPFMAPEMLHCQPCDSKVRPSIHATQE